MLSIICKVRCIMYSVFCNCTVMTIVYCVLTNCTVYSDAIRWLADTQQLSYLSSYTKPGTIQHGVYHNLKYPTINCCTILTYRPWPKINLDKPFKAFFIKINVFFYSFRHQRVVFKSDAHTFRLIEYVIEIFNSVFY